MAIFSLQEQKPFLSDLITPLYFTMPKKPPVKHFVDTVNQYCRENDIPFSLGATLRPAALFPFLDLFKAAAEFRQDLADIEAKPDTELLAMFESVLAVQCNGGGQWVPEVLHQRFMLVQSCIALFNAILNPQIMKDAGAGDLH